MAHQVKVKVKKLKIDYKKLNKALQDQSEFKEYMKDVAFIGEESLAQNIEQINTSHDSTRTPKQISHAKDYFDKTSQGVVRKGKNRPIVEVWLNGNEAVEYEAEHGVLEKTINTMRGRLGSL